MSSCVRHIQTAKCDICSQLALYSTRQFSYMLVEGTGNNRAVSTSDSHHALPKKLFCVVVMFYVALLKTSKQNPQFHSKRSYSYEGYLEIKDVLKLVPRLNKRLHIRGEC
jgi:hypothetical protein